MSRKVKDMADFGKTKKRLHSSQYYVAYIDILGTKKIVQNDENDNYLNDLNNICKNAIKRVIWFGENKKDRFIKIFSDNILIAIKWDENDNEDNDKFSLFIQLIGSIQNRALIKGYLVRGGIAKGALYKCNTFVHGKALIDAVSLEEKNAIYPRIIVQPGIKSSLPFIKKDEDGLYYINSYQCSVTSIVTMAKPILLDKLRESKKDLKVRQKVLWAINYHNNHVTHLLSYNVPEFAEYNEDFITEQEIENIIKDE